ncbi:hypothetical protein CO610_02100 [Lysobacteraceae bacterium NML95-0200]|nr:hypothetical protein CO610_02100 [Xanthomonadaceae bacterium NML95-0200]
MWLIAKAARKLNFKKETWTRDNPQGQPYWGYLQAPQELAHKFFEQYRLEGQMDELQAGIKLALAPLPKPAVLLQPCGTALNNPAF